MYQRVIHVRHGYDLCSDRDILSLQMIRVASSVKAFMMMPADLIADSAVFALLDVTEHINDITASGRMGLHHFKLLIGQFARLQKNTVGDHNLTHVMQRRRRSDDIDHILVQSVLRIISRHILRQYIRKSLHALDVIAGFQITKLHHVTHDINDMVIHVAQLFRLLAQYLGLNLHHLFQMPLVIVQLDHVSGTLLNDIRVKRFLNDIACSQTVCITFDLRRGLTGDQKNRNVIDPAASLHLLQHLNAVLNGHHYVQQYHRYLIRFGGNDIKSLFAVSRLDRFVILKNLTKNLSVNIYVIDNQYG